MLFLIIAPACLSEKFLSYLSEFGDIALIGRFLLMRIFKKLKDKK